MGMIQFEIEIRVIYQSQAAVLADREGSAVNGAAIEADSQFRPVRILIGRVRTGDTPGRKGRVLS